jgi:hypothetical protein
MLVRISDEEYASWKLFAQPCPSHEKHQQEYVMDEFLLIKVSITGLLCSYFINI